MTAFDRLISWPLHQNYPLVITETGINVDTYPSNTNDYNFFNCVSQYIQTNKLSFSIWLLTGSYLIRDTKPNAEEAFGVLTSDATQYKNQQYMDDIMKMKWNE